MPPAPSKNPNFIGFVIPKIQEDTPKDGRGHSNAAADSGAEFYKNSVSDSSSNASLAKRSQGSGAECDLYYSIDDEPPWYLTLVLGFQVSFLNFHAKTN